MERHADSSRTVAIVVACNSARSLHGSARLFAYPARPMRDAHLEIWHPTQEQDRQIQDLDAKMHQIGSLLDEIRNLKTQYDMLVRANAAARIRLSV